MGFTGGSYAQRLVDMVTGGTAQLDKLVTGRTRNDLLPPWNVECSPDDQDTIKYTLESKISLEYVPEINSWAGAGPALANELVGISLDSVAIDCDCSGSQLSHSSTRTRPSRSIKYDMSICADGLHLTGHQRESAIMFRVYLEAMKLAGGNAVDYYSLWVFFEISLWNQSPPLWGQPPTAWKDYMCAEGRRLGPSRPYEIAGKYMVWDFVNGFLSVGNKVDPTYGLQRVLGLGPFGHPGWQHPC